MNHHGGLGDLKPIPVMNRDTKNPCPKKYLYCEDITPSSSGPYVCFSSGSSCSGSQKAPPYYAYGIIVNLKHKPTGKLSEYWQPFPGDPTYQYIVETKPLKASKRVKFVDQVYICLQPSGSCGAISDIGLIPQ
jgi:hypothetical protein